MRKSQTPILLLLALSVFLLSFFVGRATALKNREESKKNAVYTGRILLSEKDQAALPTGAVSEKIEKIEESLSNSKSTSSKKESKKAEKPPERMLFPCGEKVLKEYSQTAVYSKTMDDWRAHMGIDYAAEKGSDVISSWDGVVSRVYKDNFWGYCVEISHSGSLVSIYKNLDKAISVKEGDKVSRGQVIALVGDSALMERREESHLHFELKSNGETINPNSYIY